jgi:glucose/arabinose dehydrogenase
VHADNAPGTRGALYVVEQEGVIRAVARGRIRARPFLDIRQRVMGPSEGHNEEGLLSIAFHPGYRRNRRFYVYFTNNLGDNVVMEFKRKRKKEFVALRSSARLVLYLPHPVAGNHNGGQLQFGPKDLLYISTGDGGLSGERRNNAQDTSVLLGKLLRINPVPKPMRKKGARKRRRSRRSAVASAKRRPYRIPKGNPFVGRPGRDEIYSLGLRNPFRFSFDAAKGRIDIGDVGQNCMEEIDFRNPGHAWGANFGWPRFEGTVLFRVDRAAPGAIPPIHQYNNPRFGRLPSGSPCPDVPGDFTGVSVITGYVVRDPTLTAQYGRLLYGDATRPEIRSLVASQSGASDDQDTGIDLPTGGPYSFSEGFKRRLFVLSSAGPAYRLAPTP